MLEQQLAVTLDLGLPALASLEASAVEGEMRRLARSKAVTTSQPSSGAIPALLVLPGLDAGRSMPLTLQGDKPGYLDMRPVSPDTFEPTVGIDVPDGPYVLLDVDTGMDTLGMSPRVAADHIADAGRSPLTLVEGLTLLALHPGILRERNCYQMLGSRRGDKRIASLWVTRAGHPRLGWCYEGVPHTWLGAASCARRIG